MVKYATLLVVVFAFSAAARPSLSVDKRSIQASDLLTITITLDGPFASLDDIPIPLQNLRLAGAPWISSEFLLIDGEPVRRKVFRHRARPVAPGAARVGPIVLDANGQRETLPAIAVDVIADLEAQTNDPLILLRELIATGRDPVFVVAEMDKASVFVGEPVVITWWLYNAATIHQWQIVSLPKLDDFWTEERPKEDQTERVYLGDTMVQRLPIRRAMLFPLRSGTLRIGGVAVEAAVMRRVRGGPFGMYAGTYAQTSFTSAPITLQAKPLPPGPPVDAVGAFDLACDPAMQRKAGPVVVRASLTGLGNVRAANAPRFSSDIAGTVQVEGGEVTVAREEGAFEMRRQWRYLIFPEASAPMEIPALSMRIFDPATGQRKQLTCASSFVNAVIATPPESTAAAAPPRAQRRRVWPFVVAMLFVASVVWIGPRMRRELALHRAMREIVKEATPAEIRARVEQRVHVDIREASDRGDAWRSLRSLLDAAEQERDLGVDVDREIARRVKELLRIA